ncbi:MAG: D-glucuronyl C5-epimerase family protein, partial [Solirubrobacteraceae bacterium]
MRRSLQLAAVLGGLAVVLVALGLGLAARGGVADAAARHATHRHRPAVTVPRTLQSLLRRDRITAAEYHHYLNEWIGNLREERALQGWRRAQLAGVTVLLHNLAVAGQMTAPSLPAVFTTLERNAEYWHAGRRLKYGDRVQFPGSQLVWEYYPGYGLELQVLGTFGRANGLFEAGKADYPQLTELLDEMETLAVPRAGGIAWEYYFNWDGGSPPWVSAMAQATGIEALTNGYLATGDQAYLAEAHSALALLQTPPPTGVEVKTRLGARFLQYSFAPRTMIINAFLQTLIGLYDYAQVSHDPVASQLFALGDAQAVSELPAFVVDGWSLYQPGQLDPLSYHQLVTGFIQSLCEKLSTPIYCNTYQQFQTDLTTAPVLTQTTTQTTANARFRLRFRLSKPAYVGITLRRGARRLIYTKLEFRAGARYFKAPKLKPGGYSLAMSATDLAGHYTRVSGSLKVCRGGCPAPPPVTTTTTPTTTTPTTTTPTTTTPTTTTPTTTTPTTTTPTTT